ncbi:MAG: hypothetical protein J7M25_10135 [Deltaproteobacteria bacterium]|nr:hypothetical protein [Deltaproteobacteria bacterium]
MTIQLSREAWRAARHRTRRGRWGQWELRETRVVPGGALFSFSFSLAFVLAAGFGLLMGVGLWTGCGSHDGGSNKIDARIDAAGDGSVQTDSSTAGDGQAGDAAHEDAGNTFQDGGTDGGGNLDHECDDWQNRHPEWLWCDDFEDGASITDKYPDYSTNGMTVTDQDALSGTHSLQQHYDAGQVDAGWISFFYGDTLGHDYGPVRQAIYMRWYHKFEAGFEGLPPKMARITSIGPGWNKRMGVHCWIEEDQISADVHAPDSTQANSSGWLAIQHSGFSYADPNNIGRWVCIEMYVKANTPGQTDGEYTFWVDGQRVIHQTSVDLVGSTDYHFNNAMLDCYWNDGSPKAQNRYYDNFVVSTERIGCH